MKMDIKRVFQPLGVDLFCLGKKFLVYNLVSRNLKIKYRRSFLGFFWTLLVPMATACVYYFVFKVILKVQVPHYLAFILSGVLPWTFFSQTVFEGMESITGHVGLVSKVPVPLQVFPYVCAVTNLSTLVFSLPVFVGVSLISDVPLGLSFLLLPFLFVALFLIAYSLSLILAIGFVYFRDLRHLLGIGMQLWFYGTPVIYQDTMIPPKYQWVLHANPLGGLITAVHRILGEGSWPSAALLAEVAAWTLFFVFIATLVHRFFCHELVERL